MTLLDFKLDIATFKPSIINIFALLNNSLTFRSTLYKFCFLLDPFLRYLLHALTVLFVIMPVSLLRLVIWVYKLSPPIYFAILEFTTLIFAKCTIKLIQSHSVHIIVGPLSLLPTAICPLLHPITIFLTRIEHT